MKNAFYSNSGSSSRQPREISSSKKVYREPELVEWGSIMDLTRGGMAGGEDGDFTGTNPFFGPPLPPRLPPR